MALKVRLMISLYLTALTVLISRDVNAQNCGEHALNKNIEYSFNDSATVHTVVHPNITLDNHTNQMLVGRLDILEAQAGVKMPDGQILSGPQKPSCYAYRSTNKSCPVNINGSLFRILTLVPPTNILNFTVTVNASAKIGQVFRFSYTIINCTTAPVDPVTPVMSNVTVTVNGTTAAPPINDVLPVGAIVGISVGIPLALVAVFVVACVCVRKSKSSTHSKRGSMRPIATSSNNREEGAGGDEEKGTQHVAPVPKRQASEEQPMYINVGAKGEAQREPVPPHDSIYVNEAADEAVYEAPIQNQSPVNPTYMNM